MINREQQQQQQMSTIRSDIINELHRRTRVNYPRRWVIIKGLDETFQADLVEMQSYAKQNKNYRYILVVIDIFSKFVWAEPIKTKTGGDVSKAMKKIFLSNNRIPKNLQTDLGKEFYNSQFQNLMKKFNVNHYSSYSNKKASIVERVNRTLKSLMWKEFSLQGSYKWLNILPKIVNIYNNKKHRTILMKPIDVTKKVEKQLLNTVYNRIKMTSNTVPKFKVGDNVRISKQRGVFYKSYGHNWSNEIFVIKEVKFTNPITYLIIDKSNLPIKGVFYEQELQKVKYDDIYLVETILKEKGDKVYVKWLGFDNSHNSWISKNDSYIN